LNKPKPYKTMKTLPFAFKKHLTLALILFLSGTLAWGQLRGNIITQPQNVSECSGTATVIFRVVMAKSLYGYTYQWQMAPYRSKLFQPVSVVTRGLVDDSKATLTMEFSKVSGLGPLTTELDRTQFRCVVTEKIKLAEPEISDVAFLYVLTSPSITNQPVGGDKIVGESITFSVSASGSTPRTCQWRFDGGSGYSNIPGATALTYTIANIQLSHMGTYQCVVSNICGTKYSSGAVLNVTQPIYDDGWFHQTSNTSKDISKVSFTSLLNGWACVYDQDKILHTVDGGETWTVTSTGLSYYWYSIHFTSASKGFLGGSSSIIARTTNSGSSWTKYNLHDSLDLGSTWPYIYDFHFYDANTGWAVGSNGIIIKTTNGGTSWTKLNFNGFPTAGMDGYLYAVWFINSQTGWVAGENGKIYKTTNGGLNWAPQTTPNTTNLNDITFTDADHGFAVGYGYRNLLVTSNGGTNWALISASNIPATYPYSVDFTSSSDGWIAGYLYDGSAKPDILRTNDGGVTWHRQYVEPGGDLLKHIVMFDSENGWAVGNTGTIVRTATGGCLNPTVNLYGDEALCASSSYTMYADTFAQNLNCSYLWSTGETEGHETVTQSGTYSVTVTNLCGVTAEDSKSLEFYPLPVANAGPDTFMCFGDTIQLNASGGVLFSWSPTGTLTNPNIQNPRAFPTSTRKYYVSVTDTNDCVQVDDVNVTVYPIPTSTFSAPGFVCGTEAAGISYTGSAGGGADYSWDFDGGTDTPNGNNHSVSWSGIGIKTVSLVVEQNTCVSDTTKHEVSVNPVPISGFTMPAAVCGSSQVQITYDGVDSVGASYDWNFNGGNVGSGTDEGPYQVSWATGGVKTVSLQVTQDGCVSSLTQDQIEVSYPYDGQTICLVSLDRETGKNAIIWEKGDDPAVEFYRIYRESIVGGVYTEIATLPADTLSYYVDMTSEPESKSHKYKIAVIDTCGNESDRSLYHKTMLLSTNLGPTSINLSWTEYVVESTGFGFETYIIYRGSAPNQLDSLTSIPPDNEQWIDNNPPAGNVYYQVAGVVADPCNPSGNFKAGTGPYTHSLSNLDDNKLKETSVQDLIAGAQNLRVFPNPFQDKVNVEYLLRQNSQVKIEVFNILGVRVLEIENSNQLPGTHHYEINADKLDGSSVYYLRFSVNDKTSVTKLIPAR